MLHRRSFIGCVIGLFTTSGSPFIVETCRFKSGTRLEKAKRLLRVFEISKEKLKKFRCGLALSNGDIISIHRGVKVARNLENFYVKFDFEPIRLTTNIEVMEIILIDDEDQEIRKKKLETHLVLIPDDIFETSYTLNVDF